MSNPLTGHVRIRILVNASRRFDTLKDLVNGGANVIIPNGCDLQFELMLFYGFLDPAGQLSDANRIDTTGVSSLVLALQDRSSPHATLTYWTADTTGGTRTCTLANWLAGTDEQVIGTVTSAQNQIPLDNGTDNFWLTLYAVMMDGRKALLAASPVTVADVGVPAGAPVTPVADTSNTDWKWSAAVGWCLYNHTTAKYHPFACTGNPPQLGFGAGIDLP